MSNISEQQWVLISHLGTLIWFFVPFGNIIVPLIIYSMKKESPLIQEHSRNSLNFQISITIYILVSAVLILLMIGVVFVAALALVQLVCVIIATVKADKGEVFRYPITIEFVKA